jgi:tetratricopeptide (TPR) repeat protein
MKTTSIIAILLSIFILVGCAPTTLSTATKGAYTQTLSVTNTFIPTVLPTITASPTETSAPVPTYTPAIPNGTYKLRVWSANDADLLIAQIASNLAALEYEPIYQSVYGWDSYQQQYKFLALAEEEALFRFPNAPQAEKWRWDHCYNLAVAYPYAESADAPELPCYAKLIENALNLRETTLTDLPNWLTIHEKRFDFSVTPHTAPRGYASAHVITLEDNAFIWLLEQSGQFHATGLMSSMFFFREASAKFQQLELTDDNFPELILYFDRSFCCGAFSTQFVYDISSGTPKLLSFEGLSGINTHVGSSYESSIMPLESKSEHPGLIFESHYGFDPLNQPCNVREHEKYYWDGSQFELAATQFGIDPPGEYDDKEFCQFVIGTAKESGELAVAVKIIGATGITEPDVTRDQILYRLGEYQARLGNVEKAKDYFKAAISLQPADKPASRWGKDAQAFIDHPEGKNSYYEICSKVADCSMRDALQQLIFEIPPSSFLSISELLKNTGVAIKSNGFVNFDAKGNIEQWLVIQHPHRSDREFWILVQKLDKIYGLFVATIPTNQPTLKEFAGSHDYLLTTSEGESLIALESLAFTNQSYVTTHNLIESNDPILEKDYLDHYLVEEPLDSITNQLISGTDPVLVQNQLIQLNQSKTFNCRESSLCDKVYYLMGLTSELMGDNSSAVETYLQLWKEYPYSFYTIMARSKLENP